MQETIRACNRCQIEKPLTFDYFSRGGVSNKGFSPYCHECSSKVQKPYHEKYKKDRDLENIKQLKETNQGFLFDAEAYI